MRAVLVTLRGKLPYRNFPLSATRHYTRHTIFSFCIFYTTNTYPSVMSGPGSSKEDSLRSRTSSNALTDNLSSMRYQPLHLRSSPTVRSLLPRRTPQEQREFLASILSEAMSIVDDDYPFDDDSADDDDNQGGSSNSSTSHGDRNQ
jgi:hypothetical protein